MKKVLFLLVCLVIAAGMGYILMTNKAKSDAKAKIPPPKALAVTAVPVSYETVKSDLELVGTIVANREVTIAAETQGRVRAVGPKVGDRVVAGMLLAQVDNELTRAAVNNAQANYEKAKQDLERYQFMKDQADGGVADIQVENARQTFKGAEAALIVARRHLRDTRVTAPISGVLVARPIEIGSTLMPGAPVATIVDISQLKVRVNVPEADVFKLKRGDVVKIMTDVYPGQHFEGHITMIGVKADEAHTYPVEVLVRNDAKYPLKAGMFGRVAFTSLPSRSILLVRREAIVGSVRDAKVYVLEGKKAKLRSIVVGAEFGTNLEVLSGLKQGEQVIVNGQNNLRDGVEVSVLEAAKKK